MSNITFSIRGGLSKEQIEEMHQKALQILKEVGVEIPHKEIRRILSDYNGVKIKGKRVYYKPDLVESKTKGVSYYKGGFFKILSGAYSLNVLDINTQKIRRAKLQDLVETTKLADSFGFSVVAPIIPFDIPVRIREICMYKTVLENATKPLGSGVISSLEQAEYIYALSQVVDGPFVLDLWVISPLKLDKRKLDIIFHFLDRKVPMSVATMPMAGCTSPIFFPSTFIQCMAECLGAVITLKLISRGGEVCYSFKDSFSGFPFDMKYGCMPYNSAEYVLFSLTKKQISKHYHLPYVVKSFGSASPEPNIQSAMERAICTVLAKLSGADALYNLGLMGNDDVYSPEQVVIDNQILKYVNRIFGGYEYSEVTTEIDSLKEIIPERTFLTHDSTLSYHRDLYQHLELFQYGKLSNWQSKDIVWMRNQARQIVKKRITEHSFSLDKSHQRELDKVYTSASQKLGNYGKVKN